LQKKKKKGRNRLAALNRLGPPQVGQGTYRARGAGGSGVGEVSGM
jgi:hypothetical protein